MARPRDPNQLAKLIVDISTGEAEDTVSLKKRKPHARRAGARAVGDGGAAAWTTMRSCAHPATAQRSRIRRDDRRGNLHHFFHRVTHFMGSGTIGSSHVWYDGISVCYC